MNNIHVSSKMAQPPNFQRSMKYNLTTKNALLQSIAFYTNHNTTFFACKLDAQ